MKQKVYIVVKKSDEENNGVAAVKLNLASAESVQKELGEAYVVVSATATKNSTIERN